MQKGERPQEACTPMDSCWVRGRPGSSAPKALSRGRGAGFFRALQVSFLRVAPWRAGCLVFAPGPL